MTEAAADLLRAYREVPTAQLALSGYLDIKGNVWGRHRARWARLGRHGDGCCGCR